MIARPGQSATPASRRPRRRGFTLIELMVAIGLLLVIGVMTIGFLRGALTMTRTGSARGQVFETAQTVMRMAERDFSQVIGMPAHPDGPIDDPAFLIIEDPFGRQLIAFTRAWGEEQHSFAGHTAGRGAGAQGFGQDFSGRNVDAWMRPSHGNLEVVYMMEPTRAGTRLYRAERSPPDVRGGLITKIQEWCDRYRKSDNDDITPIAALNDIDGPFAIDGEALWDQFELVADNVLAFSVDCWDEGATTTWYSGRGGPVTRWSIASRLDAGADALPKVLRLRLVVAAESVIRSESTLTGALDPFGNSVFVEDADGFPDVRSHSAYLRVNGEMIAYGSRAGRTFGSCVRGALGSRAQEHAGGSIVLAGEAFERIIQLPVTR